MGTHLSSLMAALTIRERTKRLVGLMGLMALLCACGATESPVIKQVPAEREHLPGPSEAICDPSGCGIFCMRAACGATEEACLAKCQAVCGDGYFDDRDGPVMACTIGTASDLDACTAARKCCDRDYTSQLCELPGPAAEP